MQFTKQAILEVDIDLLSPQEKKYLLEKYFPEPLPEWKNTLREVRERIQTKKLWKAYQGADCFGEFDSEYRFSNKQLKVLAEYYGKASTFAEKKGVRVTDFSKWVMSLYLRPANPSSLMRGKHIERSVARLAKPSTNPDWELVYRDPLESKPNPLKISRLTFDGEPLWGAPDLVYRNKISDEILIVERKASDKVIPSNGWPNLRAQLWAYSHIDDFIGASKITLIGEIWTEIESKLVRRAVLRWCCDDKKFDCENMEMFSLYGGMRNA